MMLLALSLANRLLVLVNITIVMFASAKVMDVRWHVLAEIGFALAVIAVCFVIMAIHAMVDERLMEAILRKEKQLY